MKTFIQSGIVVLWSGIGLCFIILRIVLGINFSLECTQYLKRAADANTVKLASENLNTAIEYLESRELTNGIVSVILKQPENDIGFWYSNLQSCQNEMKEIKPDATQLEKSNVLMKLRETLLDNDKDGTKVTCPKGISIYPNNKVYFLMIGFSTILTTFCGLGLAKEKGYI